jgi:hypothetical protein
MLSVMTETPADKKAALDGTVRGLFQTARFIDNSWKLFSV